MLKDFVQSPGAEEMRKQYAEKGCPAFTDQLGYGTLKAAFETVLPHRAYPFDNNAAFATSLPGDYIPNDMVYPDWTSVAAQVGGFGKPGKDSDTPWAAASAMRIDSDGKPDPHGGFVQFQIINVAGARSFNYHRLPDRPLGSTGPERSIIQTFRWTEPIKQEP